MASDVPIIHRCHAGDGRGSGAALLWARTVVARQPQELAIVSADALGYQHGPVIRKRDETLIEEGIDVRGQQNPIFRIEALLIRRLA